MFRSTKEAEEIFFFDLVSRTFFQAADEDYFFARQSLFLALPQQFCWHASQCIEKFLKAAILSNGGSVKDHSHGLKKLYALLEDTLKDDVPTLLFPHPSLPISVEGEKWWHLYRINDFLTYLENYGQPSVRYKGRGSRIWGATLHHFDEAVFQLRRYCIPLDGWGKKTWKENADLLANNPNLQPLGDLFCPQSADVMPAEASTHIIQHLNYSFYPVEAQATGRFHNKFIEQGTAIGRNIHSGSAPRRAVLRFLSKTRNDKNYLKEVTSICREYEEGLRKPITTDGTDLLSSMASFYYGKGQAIHQPAKTQIQSHTRDPQNKKK